VGKKWGKRSIFDLARIADASSTRGIEYSLPEYSHDVPRKQRSLATISSSMCLSAPSGLRSLLSRSFFLFRFSFFERIIDL